jgi:hypothetical protein
MSESLLRKVVNAAFKGERGDRGWLKVQAPSTTDKDISLAIMEAEQRDLVEACNVSTMDSAYPEWRLVGPTGTTEQFLRETRTSTKVWAAVVAIGAAIVAILKWVIPILVNLAKK